jgi:ABC-2 type transport system permease protein
VTTDAATRRPEPEGEVFDLGYQRYEGDRYGRAQAIRVIARDGVRASLGLGRSVSSKLLPLGLIVLVLLPAVFVIVIAGFVSSFGGDVDELELDGLSNREYYGFAFVTLMLFASMIGPEMFCPDRRNNVLVLYFTRPISPMDYVAARWLGFGAICTAILWLPQILIFFTRAMIADNPFDWMTGHLELIPQIAVSGVVIAAFLTTVALAVSSFTDRKPYAAGATLGLLIIMSVIGDILTELVTGTLGDWLGLFDILQMVLNVSNWIFREVQPEQALSSWVYIGEYFVVLAIGWIIMWRRYREAV